MVFHWCLSDSKSPQVSTSRLRTLAVVSNAVICIVSTCPPTSKSSRPFNNPLVIVSKAPITTGTIVTFMFYSFFNSLAKSRYLSFFSLSFRFILWSASKVDNFANSLFFVDYYKVSSSFSRTDAGLCIYYLLVWSILNFLHISQLVSLPTQSCLALYSFCANLLHSLIM